MTLTTTRGLTTSHLKFLALIFMTIDHLGAYAYGFPLVAKYYTLLRLLGRISAPLFLFCTVQGAIHTRSKKRYLLRLYLIGAAISAADRVFYTFWGKALGFPEFGNILNTFFFVVLGIVLLEKLIAAIKTKALPAALVISIAAVLSVALPYLLTKILRHLVQPFGATIPGKLLYAVVPAFLPQLIYASYGLPFVLLGLAMYFAKTKEKQCAVFVVFCSICTAANLIGTHRFPALVAELLSLSTYSISQCAMVLALPFLLLYNGQKGRSSKSLFYWYYPVHRYLLALLNLLAG